MNDKNANKELDEQTPDKPSRLERWKTNLFFCAIITASVAVGFVLGALIVNFPWRYYL